MSKYKMRFLIETPLKGDEDIEFRYRDHRLVFLFRTGNNTKKEIELELTCEGQNYNEAVAQASNELIPPVLDAVSFHRKTPLLLGDFVQILKAEKGFVRRKLILKDFRRYEVNPRFHRMWAEEVQRIIDSDPNLRRISLRWLRNAYRRLSILDRFVYAWLALENLSGEREVRKECPHCGVVLPAYPSANREAAYEIITAAHPTVSRRTFNDWWGRLRNSVFHGGKEPDAEFLGELHMTTDALIAAVEHYFGSKIVLQNRARPAEPIVGERGETVWHFLEFGVATPDDEFPHDVPSLRRLIELMEQGRAIQEEMGCSNVPTQSFEGW